jgi:hypothetical protein
MQKLAIGLVCIIFHVHFVTYVKPLRNDEKVKLTGAYQYEITEEHKV